LILNGYNCTDTSLLNVEEQKMREYKTKYFSHSRVDTVQPLNGCIDYYDITFVLDGEMSYSDGDRVYSLKSDDIIILRPNEKRIRNATNTVETHYCSINFYADSIDPKSRIFEKSVTQEIRQLLIMFERFYREHSERKAEKLSNIISIILAILKDKEEERLQNPHVTSILNYIYEHYRDEKLSLKEIAEHAHLAPNYCSNIIKKELDTTIFAIILNERVRAAEDYLLNSKKELEEIASLCGFNSYSYFSYTFKKLTGFSPSQFRSMH